MKKETIKWIEKAGSDLDTARYNLRGKRMDAAVFYSQQAAEKGLKAVQIEKVGKFDKIHDLVRLAKSVDADKRIVELCDKINPAYFVSRYPDMEEMYDKGDVDEILKACEEVLGWIKKRLRS